MTLEMEVRSLLLTLVLMWGQNTAFFLFFLSLLAVITTLNLQTLVLVVEFVNFALFPLLVIIAVQTNNPLNLFLLIPTTIFAAAELALVGLLLSQDPQ